jgi:sphingosine kinase
MFFVNVMASDMQDPFADPVPLAGNNASAADSTLTVGRNASLTLGTDTLIVLDEGLLEQRRINCCGLLPPKSKSTRSIPFYNILWADLTKVDLTIHYARPPSPGAISINVAYINYSLDLSSSAGSLQAAEWVVKLLDRAYGASQRQKRIKVLINPYGGTGKAGKYYTRDIEPVFAAARCELDVERTAYSGHAAEIAEKLDLEAYDVLACASGDGLPHECFNGFSRRADAQEALKKIAIVQLPCGSGNAMSWNLNGTGNASMGALAIVKGLRTPLDLASFTQGEKRTLSFLSTAIGIVAETDLGTENIRWMGPMRFTYGVLVRLLGKTLYPCDIAVKTVIETKAEIMAHYADEVTKGRQAEETSKDLMEGSKSSPPTSTGLSPLRYGTPSSPVPSDWQSVSYDNLGNFYLGNMTIMTEGAPFFPAALPSDGLMDLVTIDGDISRFKAIGLVLAVEKGAFFEQESVRFRKIEAVRVTPKFGRWADRSTKASASRLGKALRAVGIFGGEGAAKDQRDGGYIAVDGEKLPFEPFQIEVHRGLGSTLSKSGYMYESPGPTGWEAFQKGTAVSRDAMSA